MKKKALMFIIIGVGLVVFIGTLIYTGVISFDTYSANNKTATEAYSVEELTNGCFYVWHNDRTNDITKDLNGISTVPVFKLCPSGDVNWDKDTFVNHTLWFTSDNDKSIPTIYPGDKLLYISANYVPYEGISFERYADYGYTIGTANLIGDNSGHYHIYSDDGEDFQGYIYNKSDAADLNQYAMVGNLFLDKVGGVAVRNSAISDGGTVLKLDKDREYICEWYTGTYYQDFKMRANIHTFSAFESFQTFDYEFLHSNVVEIIIPDWFKTGYYYVDGLGFFRYLGDESVSLYNGKAYDSNVYWNDPIILYDEFDNVIYDPSTGVDKTNEADNMQNGNGSANRGSNVNQNNLYNGFEGNTRENVRETYNSYNQDGYSDNDLLRILNDVPVTDGSDDGAGGYEEFYGVSD